MVASGDDIEMACGILNGNLKEGQETKPEEKDGKNIHAWFSMNFLLNYACTVLLGGTYCELKQLSLVLECGCRCKSCPFLG